MSGALSRETEARAKVRDWAGLRYRLDLLVNPYGIPDGVHDALSRDDLLPGSPSALAEGLRLRLARRVGVSSDWIVLANGIDELHAMIASWRNDHGPIVVFPPSDTSLERWIRRHADQVESIERGPKFELPALGKELPIPSGSTAVVMSPNDPTGTALSVHEAVRLSRQTSLTVIDERHAAYSPRTMMPLVREFENVVVLQTFETFAALDGFPLAWAVAPPKMAAEIASRGRPSGIAMSSLIVALSALDHQPEISRNVRRVMLEKGRLYRQMRKLSMISPPYASWSNFLLCRFERGTAEFFIPELAIRGLYVSEMHDPRLLNHVRISAVSAEATNALKAALIEIALHLP
ncbi:MAG: aminotransferase class I/II-fold pyridoxal phosphate-dependent enzyme [Thermomicrobiales bacterium]